MQGLEMEVADQYGFAVKNMVPGRDAYIIITPEGKKVMRKSLLFPERLMFIHFAKEHLYKNSFENLDRYICTKEEKPFFVFDGGVYTVSDLIEGRECNLDERNDIVCASEVLASMHRASRGFTPPQGCMPRIELGKLPQYFQKRLDEIKKLRKAAVKGKNKFDYMFLEHADYFYTLGEKALGMLLNSRYEELANEAAQEGIVCHHDYTHNNILFSEAGTSVVNFDYCCIELKTYDIANLLRRKMRKCKWNSTDAKLILDSYRNVEEISRDEFDIIKITLMFPQKFWRVVNRYYNSRRSWSERGYISKMNEVTDEIEYHKRFVEKFDTLY